MTDQQMPTQTKRPRGRPRKAPADQLARKDLIRVGLVYLTERGFTDVSVDEILQASGKTKGTFYHHFKSKADYGEALIEAYHDYFAAKLQSCFSNERLSPLGRLREFVESAEAGMAKHDFRRGCLVGNLGQEMAALTPDMCTHLISVLNDWQKRTANCLQIARSEGQIAPDQDPEALAEFFWIGWEGAVLRAKLERRPEPLRHFASGFFSLLNNTPFSTPPFQTEGKQNV
ncbi:TetR/AcrR family transcriptional regulator [uncultured Cohaesibacter sp.]|uniref:acrylate utilization transcriptional regulator AcuR n=1 Tax=uncultured Cohaesibacter sp. TaxID=1002546 RepID=UPI002AA61D35|nr:TetR/AcrR family transcriptional regulator [uncultured Cohaesibacter sp.]